MRYAHHAVQCIYILCTMPIVCPFYSIWKLFIHSLQIIMYTLLINAINSFRVPMNVEFLSTNSHRKQPPPPLLSPQPTLNEQWWWSESNKKKTTTTHSIFFHSFQLIRFESVSRIETHLLCQSMFQQLVSAIQKLLRVCVRAHTQRIRRIASDMCQ